MTHLLEVMAIIGNLVQIKTDDAPAYASNKMKLFAYYDIKHITVIPYNPIGKQLYQDQITL